MRSILAVLFLMGVLTTSYSQEAEKESIAFYIPDDEEMNNYLGMAYYLNGVDDGTNVLDQATFFNLCDRYISGTSIQSMLFEMYLRQTPKEYIRNYLLKYINDKKLNTQFSEMIMKLYSAEQILDNKSDNKLIRSTFENKEYDEGINLFHLTEITVFGGELGVLSFDIDWTSLTFSDDSGKKDNDSLVLLNGGGTNSITLSFRKTSNITKDQLKNLVYLNEKKEKYKKWEVIEVPKEGIVERSGADQYYIGLGIGPDVFEDITSGNFTAYLYNEKEKILYEIDYYMNFSKINISYNYKIRIYNYLLYLCLFAYIN